jgi:hypothetical protein
MPDLKISQFTDLGPNQTPTDVVPIVQGGQNYKISLNDLFSEIGKNILSYLQATGFKYQVGVSPNVKITAQAASQTALTVNSAANPTSPIFSFQIDNIDKAYFDSDGFLKFAHTLGIKASSGGQLITIDAPSGTVSIGSYQVTIGNTLYVTNRGTIVITAGTITEAGYPILEIAGTWNALAVVQEGINLNVLDTASALDSNLLNLRLNSISKFRIRKDGVLQFGLSGPSWSIGTGSPEGAVTATVGSVYSRLDGGADTTIYVKESGSGNTGWVAISGDQLITLTGDVTGSGTGTFAVTISNNAVTYAKMQDVSGPNKVLGRFSAGAGDPQEVNVGSGFDMAAGTLLAPTSFVVALTDETTALSTGTAVITFRAPYGFTLSSVRASLTAASTSGLVTVDIKKNGVSIFSTLLTIDANELTSLTAATPFVFASNSFANDDQITIDITTAGTNAKGLKVMFIGTRSS